MSPSQNSPNPSESLQPIPESFQKIERFVVLMLENRSFDHLFGYLKTSDPRIAGLTGTEFNYQDPISPVPPPVSVSRANSFVMPFDPNHEFTDVQIQLYGPNRTPPPLANPSTDPAAMSGFVWSAISAAKAHQDNSTEDAFQIMKCFQPDQVPVLSALAAEYAVFNFWYSSIPGPTWPNRFFVHAATSGGLTDSPDSDQILDGYSFKNGTIYDRLSAAKKYWRIYHDGLPQSAGIDSLRLEFLNPLTLYFRSMDAFDHDIGQGDLPEYTFIEPNYDTGHNYQLGNSMHPLNDIRKGELLVKHVYEALRNSVFWPNMMLIITFDEHGGFYDHLSPPQTVPTGDDQRYATRSFAFDRLGVRVPAIAISAYTQKGTVIGIDPRDPTTVFDHSSILATVEKRFGLSPLTGRDAMAQTLELTLNLTAPRLTPDEAPNTLPNPMTASLFTQFLDIFRKQPTAGADNAPLSQNQKSLLALALACDLNMSDLSQHPVILGQHKSIQTQKEAADYIQEVENKITSRRP